MHTGRTLRAGLIAKRLNRKAAIAAAASGNIAVRNAPQGRRQPLQACKQKLLGLLNQAAAIYPTLLQPDQRIAGTMPTPAYQYT